MLETVKTLIYEDDDFVEITKAYLPEMPVLSYVMYDDCEICISFEYTTLMFNGGVNFSDFSELTDSVLIDLVKKAIVKVKKQYNEGVNKGCPGTAFVLHSKRDLTRQIYLSLANGVFEDDVMYDYICQSYSRIECSYGYDRLFGELKQLKRQSNGLIGLKLQESLKDKALDGSIVVYRGINSKNREDGLSYTLDLDTAKFFANRWSNGEKGTVRKYKVKIDDVVAYIDSRNEYEVLTDKAVYLCDVVV